MAPVRPVNSPARQGRGPAARWNFGAESFGRLEDEELEAIKARRAYKDERDGGAVHDCLAAQASGR